MQSNGRHNKDLQRARELEETGQSQIAKSILLRIRQRQTASAAVRAAALEQLALLEMGQHSYLDAIQYLLQAIQLEESSLSTAWRLKILAALYRQLGYKRERFQIDCRRMLTLREMALADPEVRNRIFALAELVQELTDRDLPEEAAKYEKMLRYYRDELSA